jgi:group I intron endonuclease
MAGEISPVTKLDLAKTTAMLYISRNKWETRMWCVYAIYSKSTGKVYIGLTKRTIKARWTAHRFDAKHRTRNSDFHRDINKYGRSDFLISSQYETDSFERAAEWERYLIRIRNTKEPFGYNRNFGGSGYLPHTRKASELTKERMKIALRGRGPATAETRLKMSLAKKGKPLSAEHCAALSAAQRGKLKIATSIGMLKSALIGKAPESGYRGVRKANNGWMVRMKIEGKTHYFGTFPTKEAAAAVYRAEVERRIADLEAHQNALMLPTPQHASSPP